MSAPRARIIERPDDLVATLYRPPQRMGFSGEVIGRRRVFVLEGLEDVTPVVRAIDEEELVMWASADAAVFHANPIEIASLRERLLRRTEPNADAAVDAIDRAIRAVDLGARDVAWPGGRMTLSRRAHVMAIINVTPDSFSDGGRFLDPSEAIAHGLRALEAGADLLDVGGESTRPGAEPVDATAERKRVVPVIEGLRAQTDAPISIDTMKASVAEAALDAGASIINDVSAGTADPAILSLAAERQVPIVLMHMRGEPRTMQNDPVYHDVVGDIAGYLAERAEAAHAEGVDAGRIIIDPGFGFGKTVTHNLALLRRLHELCCLGYPVLVGTSRKSFIGTTLDLPVEDRGEGTVATVALAVSKGAAIVRVHDAGSTRRVVGMVDAVMRSGDGRVQR